MNYFDDNVEENFSDQPEETKGQYDSQGNWHGEQSETPQVQVTRTTAPQPTKPNPAKQPEIEEQTESPEMEDEDGDTDEETPSVLSDARFRLEMGKLYEMIMNHELFAGVESDPRAMKSVQKEIRDFAQERMEIMLGMRQEKVEEKVNAFPMEMFPFNSLEVEILKALASTASKGASREAEPFSGPEAPPPRTTLNPIGKNSGKTTPIKMDKPAKPLQNKPSVPVKRNRAAIEQILQEEGVTMEEINEVFDPSRDHLTREQLGKMTEEQLIKRNASIRNKRAENPHTTPVPTIEQQIATYQQRSAAAETNPAWMAVIDAVKKMPPTKQ